jgi:hypothetical protein
MALVVNIFVSSVSFQFPLWQGNRWSSRAERPDRVAPIQIVAALQRWCLAVIVPGTGPKLEADGPPARPERTIAEDRATTALLEERVGYRRDR